MSRNKWKKEAAQELYDAGWKLREEGRYEQAASLLIQSLHLFQELGDWWLVAESLNHIGIGFKNLFRETRDPIFAVLTEHFFTAAYEIILQHNPTNGQVSVQAMKLGEGAMINGHHERAIEYFQLAIDKDRNPSLGSLGYKKHHLGYAYFLQAYKTKNNEFQQQGEKLVREGISLVDKELADSAKRNEERQLRIWQTGGLMTLARVIFETNAEQARELVQEALVIAQKHDLAIRIQHAQSLLELINQGQKEQILFSV